MNKVLVFIIPLMSALSLLPFTRCYAEPLLKNKETSLGQPLAFTAQGIPQYDTIKGWISCVNPDPLLSRVAHTLKYDLEFTDQFTIDLKQTTKILSTSTHEKVFNQGVSVCAYLEKKNDAEIRLTLFDTASKKNIFEKSYNVANSNQHAFFHAISGDVLECLTASRGICEGSLAYTKTCGPSKKIVCVADYVGNEEKTLINNNMVNVALSWHSKVPMLFYSQLERTTSKLLGYNLENKRKKVACAYQGLNMQPSFSSDGKKTAVCISAGGTSQIYLYGKQEDSKSKKKRFKKLTNNNGANASPILLENDNVIFCSDFETGSPQIYFLDSTKHTIHRLTNGEGYCAAPSYCPKTKMLTYARRLDGTFQVFSVSLSKTDHAQGAERQVTFGAGDKYEPVISPCGQYVYCLYSPDGIASAKSPAQVAVLNIRSGKLRTLTTSKQAKGFPAFTAHSWHTLA